MRFHVLRRVSEITVRWDVVSAEEQACCSQADSRSKQRFASTAFLKGEQLAQQLLEAVRELTLKYPKGRSLTCDNCISPYSA